MQSVKGKKAVSIRHFSNYPQAFIFIHLIFNTSREMKSIFPQTVCLKQITEEKIFE